MAGHLKKTSWLSLAAVLYVISLVLPAVEHDGKAVWLGAQAAAFAVFIPAVWSLLPLGLLLGMLYPLLGVTLFGILKKRAFASGAAVALVSTMALWGFSVPARPESNIFGGTHPGGQLGSGFWLWLASGVCLLVASLESRGPKRLGHWTIAGLGYAAVVALLALVMAGLRLEAARHPTDAERGAVEAEKNEYIRKASPKPSR